MKDQEIGTKVLSLMKLGKMKFLYHSIRMWIVRGVLNPLAELVKDCVPIEKDNDKLQLSEIEAPDTKKRRLIQKTEKG